MIGQLNIFGKDKVEVAIDRIKAFEPPEGYYLAFSGGKDSQAIYELAKMAGVKFDAHYTITSVDPPELVYFIRDHYPDVHMDKPLDDKGEQVTMWRLIAAQTMPPTRKARYCCAKLKEPGGVGRVTMTGVRWAESTNRKKNQGAVTIQGKNKTTQKMLAEIGADFKRNERGGVVLNLDNEETRRAVEICYRTRKTLVNPIIDWTDGDVWGFLDDVAQVPHCCLYDEGFTRLGCIGCPMGGRNMKRDFERWPKYENLYIHAFERMLKNHPGEIRIATSEIARGGGERYSQLGSSGVQDVASMARRVMEWWTQ